MQIIDASVVVKWLIKEEDSHAEQVKLLLEKYLDKEIELIAPDILLYEVSNVLVNKSNLPQTEINRLVEYLRLLDIPLYVPDIKFFNIIIKFAKVKKISAYDAAYVILAQEKACDFITADKKLVEKVKLPFVKLL